MQKRLKNGGNKCVLDLLSAITGVSIEVDKSGRVVFKTREGEEEKIKPSDVSVKEITRILLPLVDIQTPALVLIEELEASLNQASQLLLVMLSMVQHGYKFVISSHGELMSSFLGDLVRYKQSKEEIAELLKSKFGYEPLPSSVMEEAEKTIRENSIKVYYFENGTAREVSVKELK